MQITLVNYPLLSFPDQELLVLQDNGVKFQMNSLNDPDDFTSGGWNFNGAGYKYRVAPAPASNIALFEKLACIHPKKTPRKHHELIKTWADDATVVVQYWNSFTGEWRNVIDNPLWCDKTEYRIKPTESISEQTLKDIQQGLTAGIATCLGMLILKEEV